MLSEVIAKICDSIQTVCDLFWNFPTNLHWWGNIPVLGHLSLAIIILVGSGIYFSIRMGFVQVRKFSYGIRLLTHSRSTKQGISPLASFFLSTAMRVGPGNILGVTGAISIGGPGALFWMWVSAFFGMATAFTESTLSQIYKEKNGRDYVGGFAFYGRKLLGDSASVGVFLSVLYIIYALLCFPSQGFNTISAIDQIASTISGLQFDGTSTLNWICLAALLVFMVVISFGGIRKVTKVTDLAVPVMAVIYIVVVIVLCAANLDRIPWFFKAVFTGALRPEAAFGGSIGLCLMQGIKRGLMSNEAGQGTLTMAAAASDAKHPCDQGCIQSIGVFLDTMVICTLTAFIVIMARQWTGDDAAAWMAMGKLQKFVSSAAALTPGTSTLYARIVDITISLCFGLFAFTCLLGFMSFTEISAARISRSPIFISLVRILCLAVVAFGVLTSMAGLDLSALWNLSDFANILMVLFNLPLLYLGLPQVIQSLHSSPDSLLN